MLTQIHIKNFTIIDEICCDFQSGMTVLTGETGAGKSILIDALNLALGSRADASLIRLGEEKATITVCFNIRELPTAKKWLAERELEHEDECILRRVIYQAGRSSAYINGIATPIAQIKELAQLLINIHGQHEHHALLKQDFQRYLLDTFGKNQSVLKELKEIYKNWQQASSRLALIVENMEQTDDKEALLKYQLTELEQLNLAEDEVNQLHQEQQMLAHTDELTALFQATTNQLMHDEQYAISSTLQHIINQLHAHLPHQNNLKNSIDLLQNARVLIDEASHEIDSLFDHLELDPNRLKQVETRLSTIHQLARKHRIKPDELFAFHIKLNTDLEKLKHNQNEMTQIKEEIDNLNQQYLVLAKKLSELRKQSAKKLTRVVTEKIKQLGMPDCIFEIAINTKTQNLLSPHGIDHIEFLVKTNPGQALSPLAKIASGGELSRICLAIDVICGELHSMPCIIFDEIDSGIGGRIAAIVGQQLKILSEHCQVLCVTHLAQVASQASHHFQITKQSNNQNTKTIITTLNETQRIDEIARMLSGEKITKQTLAHAKELLTDAI